MDWLCGGSLISDQHVLTAAHCSISHSGPPQKVRLGSVSLHNNDDFVQDFIIDYFVNHPEYKRPMKYHDIAIMFLKKFVTFTAFVRPACLNTVEKLPFTEARATGFGLTTHGMSGIFCIVLDDPYCMYSIIGVTSFGRFCGMSYSPGIYTKVDRYVEWIESTIWTTNHTKNELENV
ncbi:hypothetical protein D910_09228 [Dendroctonus ponderosae]|uniref:Peptidase S1 domain-containing protein n=1 Tax=Dendroctonus ponderosae TaxID=77166 RepID=U4UPG0_DENPD|nr:hypothetical protein D910_09228 [Dendroctonus ponderosae]